MRLFKEKKRNLLKIATIIENRKVKEKKIRKITARNHFCLLAKW